jgi:hypothetical protein
VSPSQHTLDNHQVLLAALPSIGQMKRKQCHKPEAGENKEGAADAVKPSPGKHQKPDHQGNRALRGSKIWWNFAALRHFFVLI